jgi:hypothetical protein
MAATKSIRMLLDSAVARAGPDPFARFARSIQGETALLLPRRDGMNCRDRQTLPTAGRTLGRGTPCFPRKTQRTNGTRLAIPLSAAKHLSGIFA